MTRRWRALRWAVLAVLATGCGDGADAADSASDTRDASETTVMDTIEDADASLDDTLIDDTSIDDVDATVDDTTVDDTIGEVDATIDDTPIDDTPIDDTPIDDTIDEVDATVDATTVDAEDADVVAPAPLVGFRLENPRALYFLNNPEQLVLTDLGDATLGDTTLLRVTAIGPCRSFFEHLNKTGRTLGFGIQAYNPGPGARSVTVRGAGFVASIQGGTPFADALAGAGAATSVSIAAGGSIWILRRDEAIANGTFFSGVLDYDIEGGSLIVNHVAYDAFAGLDGSTAAQGYIQRIEPDGTHEARLYKGLATASEAHLDDLAWDVDDATPDGPLALRVRRWDLQTGAFGNPIAATRWVTHIGPGQNVDATTSDMVAFNLAGWGRFDPRVASDGEGKYPNLGNWGVVYRLAPRVTNHGTATRRAVLRLTASPGASAALAHRVAAGAWSATHVAAGATLDLVAVTIVPGETVTLDASWGLGGPSGGAIAHAIVLSTP